MFLTVSCKREINRFMARSCANTELVHLLLLPAKQAVNRHGNCFFQGQSEGNAFGRQRSALTDIWLGWKPRQEMCCFQLCYFALLLSMQIFGGAREELLPAQLSLPSRSTQSLCRMFSVQRPHSTSASNILLWKVTFNTKSVLTTSTWVGLTDWFWSWLSFESDIY